MWVTVLGWGGEWCLVGGRDAGAEDWPPSCLRLSSFRIPRLRSGADSLAPQWPTRDCLPCPPIVQLEWNPTWARPHGVDGPAGWPTLSLPLCSRAQTADGQGRDRGPRRPPSHWRQDPWPICCWGQRPGCCLRGVSHLAAVPSLGRSSSSALAWESKPGGGL